MVGTRGELSRGAPTSGSSSASAAEHPVDTGATVDQRAGLHTWLWVHLATLVVAIPVLAWINRDQWFAADEWRLVTTNGLGSNPTRASIFAPHFEHWVTLGVLVYKALYGVFALRTYVPYVAVFIAVILAVAHLSWRLLLRIGVGPPFATAVAALTIVMAVGWENRSTAFQMVVIAPVALGFGALLLMPERGRWQPRDLGVTALLLIGLACSGVGVTLTAVVALAALLRRGWKVALSIVAGPAAVYAIWFVLEGRSGQRNETALSTALRDLPQFVWRGLTEALSDLTRIPHTGGLVLAVIVAWLVWSVWRDGPRVEPWPIVIATTLGAVASIALTGLRRAGAPPVSRYSDIVVLLALPALALLTQHAGRWLIRRLGRPALVVFSMVTVAFLVVQVTALNDDVSNEAFVGEMRPRVLATAKILRDHEPIASSNIFGVLYLDEPSTSTIARLDRNGELPGLDVSTADVLTAREYVGAVIGDASKYPEGVVRTVRIAGGSSGAAAPGCLTVAPATTGPRPVVLLALPSAGSFRVATDRAATASMTFVQDDARGRPRLIDTSPGDGTGVGVARATNVELTLPPTTTTLCGLDGAEVRGR
ncbi:MAG TPA: hypothetical protein VK549_02955 [Acidimicrobiia bacterium]|nr:hypothetical protein [Acidimicrobiia bacterium]